MGYRTLHTVTTDADADEEEKIFERLKEITGYHDDYFNGMESSKWYEMNDDMITLSAEFPEVKLRVDGNGDSEGDIWVVWYHGGKKTGGWALEYDVPDGFDPPESENG